MGRKKTYEGEKSASVTFKLAESHKEELFTIARVMKTDATALIRESLVETRPALLRRYNDYVERMLKADAASARALRVLEAFPEEDRPLAVELYNVARLHATEDARRDAMVKRNTRKSVVFNRVVGVVLRTLKMEDDVERQAADVRPMPADDLGKGKEG